MPNSSATKGRRTLASGARQLPLQHLSVRVPWHDTDWTGRVCRSPLDNTSCRILPRIGQSKDDQKELACAGKSFDELAPGQLPPCVAERASFMATYEMERAVVHPYSKGKHPLYQNFVETRFRTPAYSAACIPYHWMHKQNVEANTTNNLRGFAKRLELSYDEAREPELSFPTAWVQERSNQLVMLDTFFSAIREDESLCFFYAKRTPLSEDPRRVIVGVGRVTAVGPHIEYDYDTDAPAFRCVLWERMVTHSIRPGFEDGFLFPYQELVDRAGKDPAMNLEDFVAFAPTGDFEEFSYGSSHVSHDSAIASLLACAAAIQRIAEVLEGPWHQVLEWLDRSLNRLWKMRGAYPGLGSALTAVGWPHGNLVAYELAGAVPDASPEAFDPWAVLEAELAAPSGRFPDLARLVGPTYRKLLASLPAERKALLKLLSRFALNDDQAVRLFDREKREATDGDLLANPYLLFELDRGAQDPVPLEVVDRGMFPDQVILAHHPIPEPSAPADALDPRRARALVVEVLARGAQAGHTLLPLHQVVAAVADLEITPPCPLTRDTIPVVQEAFAPAIETIELPGGHAFQLDVYAKTRALIASAVNRRSTANRHSADHDWRALLDAVLGGMGRADEELEERARMEKAAALAELYASRIAVLVGSAGTGKTTLLRALCGLAEVDAGGVLLLAPTGKARARIEQNTGRRARTLAQFLLQYGRFEGRTQRYLVTGNPNKEKGYKTIIVDESSMLTEDQLAALLDAVTGVERLILVGDPQQLPPIGAGRPFVDIVKRLEPSALSDLFPRVGSGYAELTVTRRQAGRDRDDLQLAQWFASGGNEATLDVAWETIHAGRSPNVDLVRWTSPEDLQSQLLASIVAELKLTGPDDENGFELSLGGSPYKDLVYFWAANSKNEGAAAKAEAWQILSPHRAGLHGADALNLAIQTSFRKRAIKWAKQPHWQRRVMKPLGPQSIVYGDKVMSVINGLRRKTYPNQKEPLYIANGDIGMVVGQFKRNADTYDGPPWELQIEYQANPGVQVKYFDSEFRDDGVPPLELAYALTVHKTQGSEFDTTFVILPNPSRLLSRELLYTALTRHREKIVILHQNEFRDLMKYNSDFYSDIARRFTNLFRLPRATELASERAGGWFDENLIHRTRRGELVRSKSELVIADALLREGVDYAYEVPLVAGDGSKRLPDFTIEDSERGRTIYWEHLGMLHDPSYRRRWKEKVAWYKEQGILPHEEGGGPRGTLVVTEDGPGKGLDSLKLERLIKEVILEC